MVLTTELKILAFIRSLREGNFEAYKEAIIALLPHFFNNDNTHYSRWLTGHLIDMLVLENTFPDVHKQFQKGNFVIHKTERIFSGIAIDQAHEQNNALIKADGGAISLTERESALRRWMVAGPEVFRLAEQYGKFSRKREKYTPSIMKTLPLQKTFLKDVRNLILVLEEMGNPFLEESTTNLLTIDSKDVMNKSVLDMLYASVPRGKEQLNNFLKNLSGNFYAPLTRNKFSLFETSKTKQTKEHDKLKDDYNLFLNLFVSCQTRQVDLNEFFKYENQIARAALSSHGELYKTNKADLLTSLETITPAESVQPVVDSIAIDGSCLAHIVKPKELTFRNYAGKDFVGKVTSYASKQKRTYVVFDTYKSNSLKSYTRLTRGRGSRRRMTRKSAP